MASSQGLPRRIVKETHRLSSDPVPGITCTVDDKNPRFFHIVIEGPEGTLYGGGYFHLELFLPGDYPMSPPKVRFLTKIYHPNVDKIGRICLDILKDKWSPALQIRTVLLSIQALLSTPEPDDPLDETIGTHFKTNRADADATAKDWTRTFAKKDQTELLVRLGYA